MPPDRDQHFFSGALNPTILGGTFTAVHGDAHFHPSVPKRQGLTLLLYKIAEGAFHDAAERGDPPRCHAQTRTVILGEIVHWIKSRDARRKFIIWLYGPAGAGKSAIAQSIAEACEKEGLLAASFFFSRTAAGRNTSIRFVATLAYQLMRCIPEMHDHVLAAIEEDPVIFSRALATQIRVLVIDPIKKAARLKQPLHLLTNPAFVIVDGVDECGNGESQTELLGAIATAVLELKHIPIIFLIASRPEYEIRQAFNEEPLTSLMKGMVLDDNYKPDEDIKRYLNSSFLKIRQKYLKLSNSLPHSEPWPTEKDINSLVEKSSGQFIFAATAIKFVDSPRNDPAERLKIILGLSGPGLKDTPFALLDALYRFILSSVADLPKVLEILTLLMFADKNDLDYPMHVEMLEELLGYDVRRALIDMHALVFVPPPGAHFNAVLRLHHASMYDFLLDRSRSCEYAIDAMQGHIALSRHWIKALSRYTQSEFSRIYPLNRCVEAFVRHCIKLPPNIEIAADLAAFGLKSMLEEIGPVTNLYLANWGDFLYCAQQQGGSSNEVFPRLQNEFDTFILNRLSQYPPTLRSCLPAMFTFDSYDTREDVFRILLYSGNPSQPEQTRLRKLDARLLNICNTHFSHTSMFAELFKDKARSGEYFLDGTSYVPLVKEIVGVLCPKPEEMELQTSSDTNGFTYNESNRTHIELTYTGLRCLTKILPLTSTDRHLAISLRDRSLQLRNGMSSTKEREKFAGASLIYIKKCGIPYRKHIHPPNMSKCFICILTKHVSVVESLSDILGDTSPSSPPTNLLESQQHIERNAARSRRSKWRHLWICNSSISIDD